MTTPQQNYEKRLASRCRRKTELVIAIAADVKKARAAERYADAIIRGTVSRKKLSISKFTKDINNC